MSKLGHIFGAKREKGSAFNSAKYKVTVFDESLGEYQERTPTEEEVKAAKNQAKRARRNAR